MTIIEAIEAAQRDYAGALMTVIKPDVITGYIGNDSVDIETKGRVEVRVIQTSAWDIAHNTGGFIDPYWNVEVVSDPDGLLANVRSIWVFGPAHEYKQSVTP